MAEPEVTLIVGRGQIGMALHGVLLDACLVRALDVGDDLPHHLVDVMHVCFPYSAAFEAEVQRYQEACKPRLTIVHSTVPVGTSRGLGAVHSPVMGIHPNLEQSLRTFTKFIGGPRASDAARHLMRAGIRCYVTGRSETTELMKLLSTTFYGLCIEWTKHVKGMCDEAGAPFEAWTLWTQTYNAGYAALGHPEYARPNLIPLEGQIGGHCVLPNLGLLPKGDPFVELIRERNE